MKKALLILLSVLLLISAAGCAKEPAHSGKTEHTKPREEAENHFIGTWYKDGDMTDMCMEFLPDGSWTLYDALEDGEDSPAILSAGTAKMGKRGKLRIYCDAEEAASASFNDDSSIDIVPQSDGTWCLDYGFRLYREEDSWMPETEPEPLPDFDEFVGLWKYDDDSGWFRIYEDATWYFLNEYSDVMGEGTLVPQEDCIELQGGGDTLRMFVTGPDSLVDGMGDTLTRVDSIEPTPFFDANGLYPNIGTDDGRTCLENGAYYRLKDNSEYLQGDGYWQVELLGREESENGRETVGILATCGFTGEEADQLSEGKKSHGCMSYLCDRYTGAILPVASSNGNVDGNENMYSASLQVGEESIDIFYTVDLKWDNDDPDWEHMFYQTIYVEFPAEYDGLMLCMIAMPETAEQNQDYIDRDNARAVPEVMGEDYMESIRNGLIFSIG